MKLLQAFILTTALLATAGYSKSPELTAPSTPATIFELKQLDTPPKALEQPLPVYPSRLRFANVQGQAVLRFVVDAKGETRDIEVLKTDHADFATAAVDSVKQWRFKPALKARQAVHCRMELPVVFTLSSK